MCQVLHAVKSLVELNGATHQVNVKHLHKLVQLQEFCLKYMYVFLTRIFKEPLLPTPQSLCTQHSLQPFEFSSSLDLLQHFTGSWKPRKRKLHVGILPSPYFSQIKSAKRDPPTMLVELCELVTERRI